MVVSAKSEAVIVSTKLYNKNLPSVWLKNKIHRRGRKKKKETRKVKDCEVPFEANFGVPGWEVPRVFSPWAGVGFSVVIYVEWFKTEVNRLGKLARGGRCCACPGASSSLLLHILSDPDRDCSSNGTRLRRPPNTRPAGFLPAPYRVVWM